MRRLLRFTVGLFVGFCSGYLLGTWDTFLRMREVCP